MHILFQVIGILILLLCFLFVRRCIIEKRKLGLIPTRTIEGLVYFYLLKDLCGFPTVERNVPEYSSSTRMFQYFTSFYKLFKNEKIFSVWIGFTSFVNLKTPDAIEEVLNGTKAIEKAWFYKWIHCWLGTGLLTSNGSKWKSRRKLLTPAFHFDILKDFLPIFNERSTQLVEILKKDITKEYTNIGLPITLCSLDIICETTLGVDIKAQENEESEYVKAVGRVSDALTKRLISLWGWTDWTYFLTDGRKIIKDLKLLHEFTISVIQERKKKLLSKTPENKLRRKRKPLIDVLLEHHIETKDLTEADIREEVDTFTFEGHDTTATAMTWSLHLIGLYKDVQKKIHEELDQIFGDDTERPVFVEDLKEMKYLECVLKETLRLFPSVPAIGRRADKDMNICGYPITRGTTLIIFPYEVHRDENLYPNPEIFDPSRFTPENSINRHPYAYIPFSAGSRNCIGQRFAMMEEKTIIANILRNFTLESLDPRDKVVTSLELILRPARPIRIKIRPRNKQQM